MKDNLELFRDKCKDFIPAESIADIEEFRQLASHLCDSKLLHPSEVKQLTHRLSNSAEIKFPINFQQLEQLISTNAATQ